MALYSRGFKFHFKVNQHKAALVLPWCNTATNSVWIQKPLKNCWTMLTALYTLLLPSKVNRL